MSDLKQIEDLAACFLTPDEITIVLQKEGEARFYSDLRNPKAEIGLAYQRGRLKRKAEVYSKIMTLAAEGSIPAQEMAVKIIKDSNSDL